MKVIYPLLPLLMTLQLAYAQADSTATKPQVRALILKESQEGGKLDFFTPIKGHEYDGIQVKPGVFDTKGGLALIKWGKNAYELGVKSLDEAYAIFAEFKGRKVSPREIDYIKIGYNREL